MNTIYALDHGPQKACFFYAKEDNAIRAWRETPLSTLYKRTFAPGAPDIQRFNPLTGSSSERAWTEVSWQDLPWKVVDILKAGRPCADCGKPGHKPQDHKGWDPTKEGHG